MNEAIGRNSCRLPACHALYCCGTPVGANIGKDLSPTSEEVPKQHCNAVERVVFCCHKVWLADAVPVEARIENGLHKVAVGEVISPLPLPLESGQNCVVPQGLLVSAFALKVRVAHHEVAHDYGHLDAGFPRLVHSGARMPHGWRIVVRAFHAVFLCPLHGAFEFGIGIDLFVQAAHNLAHVDILVAHAKVFLEEIRIDDGTRDAHGNIANGEIALVAHRGRGNGSPCKLKDFLRNVLWNVADVAHVLYVAAIDSKGWQAFLIVCGKNSR